MQDLHADFMSLVQKTMDNSLPNVSVTENGAIGYATSGSKLVDLNFALSSMRNMTSDAIVAMYRDAYNENPIMAMVWLFFARDVRGGCGERRVFRIIFEWLCYENTESAIRLLRLIPFYGRWDDVIDVVFSSVPCKVRDEANNMINRQMQSDILSANTGNNVSLLAKWMPSLNTSSKESCRRAEFLRLSLGWSPKQYRKNLSGLRKRINIVEKQMSANEWEQINYGAVPSRASMNYRKAFGRHDRDRYDKYLTDVKSGNAKIHSGVLFPHDIVHAYHVPYFLPNKPDETLEEQWKALPNKVKPGSETLVIVDGSGSMADRIGNTKISCHDVANALGIYFAERLSGPYHNSFITFSKNPQFVRFADGLSLHAKLCITEKHCDCSNTNIEKTFDMILDTAVANHLKQEEVPANVLIVSDMEFDRATGHYDPRIGMVSDIPDGLFNTIRARWEEAGYKMPRLVFWNVLSRTCTIPVNENDLGVALVSGFSPNVASMVMSGATDPYSVLVEKLMSDRYDQVREALRGKDE